MSLTPVKKMTDMPPIPQFVPYWGRDESRAAADILDNSDYLNEHENVRRFEREFADRVGAKHCAAVTSGTTALYIAACVAFKDEAVPVNVPSHDGIFALNALIAAGVKPAVVDVDESGLLDASLYDNESVVVHANGRVAGHVGRVEDCAQAITHHTKGSISTYSFASTKHITTAGQGGAVCCDSDDEFEQIVRLKDHGRTDRQLLKPMSDSYDQWGLNFKMTEIQAAFGLVQLHDLTRRLRRLEEMYLTYKSMLEGSVGFDTVLPGWYVDVFADESSGIIQHLKKSNIHCRAYPKPLHLQSVAMPYVSSNRTFTNSESRYSRGIYLPSTTNLRDDDVKRVALEVLDALG